MKTLGKLVVAATLVAQCGSVPHSHMIAMVGISSENDPLRVRYFTDLLPVDRTLRIGIL